MRLRSMAAVAALLASVAVAKEREYRGRRVNLEEPPRAQLAGYVPLHPLEGELKLDGLAFAVENGSAGPRVATSPGGAVFAPLASGKTVVFKWKDAQGADREAAVRFVEVGGRWGHHGARGYRYRIADEEIVLVDLDSDGRFDLARDGFLPGEGAVACPLAPTVVLGRETVRFVTLAPDGSSLVADTTPVEGAPQQLDALVALNRFRLRNGLLPVVLDAKLSAGCTAHARYLELNRWSGMTNPHSQSLGPKGASPEGEAASKRSDISGRAPADAVPGLFLTYYHRISILSPWLPRVGVNAEPAGLSVLDSGDAFWSEADPAAAKAEPAADPPSPLWSVPCFVPADGSSGFPVGAISEMPRDPVPDMGRRGCPLMMYFRPEGPAVAGFRAEMVAIAGRREIPVPFLLADRGDYPWVYGLVPEGRLKGNTWHRVTWIYTLDGKEVRHAVRFRTE